MPYWRLFYHVVWATKDREPVIREDFASSLHRYLTDKATKLGADVYALDGVEDHVHLVTSVPPSLALSEFIRQLKGSSSHFVNHEFSSSRPFAWQAQYGILSLDGKQLEKTVQYVKAQRQHHTERTTIPVLERTVPDNPSMAQI